ncbi:MAG: hypothetical protein ACR2KB_14525 [Chitinophagaceae bacterium]
MKEENKNQFSEEEINYFYEKAEMDQLREALKRTHSERFHVMMLLIKQGLMFKNAKILHKPFVKK